MTVKTSYVLYGWVVLEADGTEGLVSAFVPGIGHVPLITRQENIAKKMFRPHAQAHADSTGLPVRLLKFTDPEVLETL